MLDSDLNCSAHMAYVQKVSWKIAALQQAGQKSNRAAKRQCLYPLSDQILNTGQIPSFKAYQLWQRFS